jgi:hypothetical protein
MSRNRANGVLVVGGGVVKVTAKQANAQHYFTTAWRRLFLFDCFLALNNNNNLNETT